MATIDEIKQQAAAVKNATQVGENTAERVGGALAGLADIAEQQDSKLSDLFGVHVTKTANILDNSIKKGDCVTVYVKETTVELSGYVYTSEGFKNVFSTETPKVISFIAEEDYDYFRLYVSTEVTFDCYVKVTKYSSEVFNSNVTDGVVGGYVIPLLTPLRGTSDYVADYEFKKGDLVKVSVDDVEDNQPLTISVYYNQDFVPTKDYITVDSKNNEIFTVPVDSYHLRIYSDGVKFLKGNIYVSKASGIIPTKINELENKSSNKKLMFYTAGGKRYIKINYNASTNQIEVTIPATGSDYFWSADDFAFFKSTGETLYFDVTFDRVHVLYFSKKKSTILSTIYGVGETADIDPGDFIIASVYIANYGGTISFIYNWVCRKGIIYTGFNGIDNALGYSDINSSNVQNVILNTYNLAKVNSNTISIEFITDGIASGEKIDPTKTIVKLSVKKGNAYLFYELGYSTYTAKEDETFEFTIAGSYIPNCLSIGFNLDTKTFEPIGKAGNYIMIFAAWVDYYKKVYGQIIYYSPAVTDVNGWSTNKEWVSENYNQQFAISPYLIKKLQKGLENKPDLGNVLVLGDSYTQGGQWINYLRNFVNMTSLVNVAKSSATLKDAQKDRQQYPYNSRPGGNNSAYGIDNSNTFACQIEKIKRLMQGTDLDTGEVQIYKSEKDYPNTILIAGGKNDSEDTASSADDYYNVLYEKKNDVYVTSYGSTPQKGSVTLVKGIDTIDRTTFIGAMFYLVKSLEDMFGKEINIFFITPSNLFYGNTKELVIKDIKVSESIKLASNMLSIPVIDWNKNGRLSYAFDNLNQLSGDGTESNPYNATGSTYFTSDMLHPNNKGYMILAKVVASYLKNYVL